MTNVHPTIARICRTVLFPDLDAEGRCRRRQLEKSLRVRRETCPQCGGPLVGNEDGCAGHCTRCEQRGQ